MANDTFHIKTAKIDVKITKKKDPRGRVLGYEASFGDIQSTGTTAQEAEKFLVQKLTRLVTESADPVVMLEDHRNGDAHAWVTYRDTWGNWGYAHYRPLVNGPAGTTQWSGGTMTGSGERSAAVFAMRRHFEQNNPRSTAVPATALEPAVG